MSSAMATRSSIRSILARWMTMLTVSGNLSATTWTASERFLAEAAMASSTRQLSAPRLRTELTHRCPLGCPYCSNPLAMDGRDDELDAATWARVFREAAELGVLQVHLSGGEPASRRDLAVMARLAAVLMSCAAHPTRPDSKPKPMHRYFVRGCFKKVFI
jgi:uncharacterized radical SAM superfamily Fe-S cluster-containing enzyme